MTPRNPAIALLGGLLGVGVAAACLAQVRVVAPAPVETVRSTTTVSTIAPQPAKPASMPGPASPAAATQPMVTTAEDDQITGPLEAIRDGKLVVGRQPRRSIPLADVQLVTMPAQVTVTTPPRLTAAWLGQDGHDLVGKAPNPGPNGIQDVHVRLSGLTPAITIHQLTITSTPDPGSSAGMWRFGFTGGFGWAVAIEQQPGAGTADLYFEPVRDLFNHDLTIQVYYQGMPANAAPVTLNLKATTHTNDALKVAAPAKPSPSAAPSGPVTASVILEEGDRLEGKLLALGADSARLQTAARPEAEIPLVQILGIRFPTAAAAAKGADPFQAELKASHADDLAMIQSPDGVTRVAGKVKGIEAGKLQFDYEGKTRKVKLERLVGVIFATHAPVRKPDAMIHVFKLAGDQQISGTWTAVSPAGFELTTPWDQHLSLATASVKSIGIRNGRVTYLSDLEPIAVDEVPYFDRVMHYQRDQSLTGDPLKVAGKVYTKGLAVHSRCVLRYALDGHYARFRAVLGFDDPAGKQGRASCRVLADGQPRFTEADARGDQPPRTIDLSTSGVRELTLEVDFGAAEDTADRLIWANARVLK